MIGEAMACGVPVLASRVSDNPLLVDDGRTGLLFDPGSARDIADAMVRFADLPAEARARMGLEGRRRAEAMLSPETMIDSFIRLMTRLIRDRRGVSEPEDSEPKTSSAMRPARLTGVAIHALTGLLLLVFLTVFDQQLILHEVLPLHGVVVFASLASVTLIVAAATRTIELGEVYSEAVHILSRFRLFAIGFLALVLLSLIHLVIPPRPSLTDALYIASPSGRLRLDGAAFVHPADSDEPPELPVRGIRGLLRNGLGRRAPASHILRHGVPGVRLRVEPQRGSTPAGDANSSTPQLPPADAHEPALAVRIWSDCLHDPVQGWLAGISRAGRLLHVDDSGAIPQAPPRQLCPGGGDGPLACCPHPWSRSGP